MCWSPIQLRSELCGMICSFRRSLSFPLKVSSPSSNALRNPGLVDVVHRVCGAPRAVSGSWWLSLADGVHPSCVGHWEATQARTVLSGQRPFLPFSLRPPPPPAATHSPVVVLIRTGRVRELTRSSRSKFKMVWHQFSTNHYPNHQFVWEVRSVQFGTRGPRHGRA